jgi:hypothetical protein
MQVSRPQAYYDVIKRYPPNSITSDARAYSELAIDFIVHSPADAAILALTKLERFWWTISPERLGEYEEGRLAALLGFTTDHAAITLVSKLLHVGSIPLALGGALWGAQWSARRASAPRAGYALLVSAVAAFWLVHIPFISEPRYRIPITPLVQVFEAAGLVALRRRLWPLP